MAVKILSFNLCAATSMEKMAALFELVREKDPDIVMLQEVRAPVINCPGFEEVVNIGTEARGTALLVRAPLKATDIRTLPSGRGISAVIAGVTFVNVYGPAGSQGRGERPHFLINQLALLLADVGGPIVLGGDWNCIARDQDTTGVTQPCRVLKNVIKDLQLEDAWLRLHPREEGFTYRGPSCRSRLDRVYVTKDLAPRLHEASLQAAAFGDHLALAVSITLDSAPRQQQQRRAGIMWKFDPAVLSDPCFLTAFEEKWRLWSRHRGEDVVSWWEGAKTRTRDFCRAYSKRSRNESNVMLMFLSSCLNELAARLYQHDGDQQELQQDLDDVRARMLELMSRRLAGTRARAKVQDEVDGEAVGMHHVAAALRRRVRGAIEVLEDNEGKVLDNAKDIAEYVRAHYKAIFAAPELAPGSAATSLLDEVVPEAVLEPEDSEAVLRPFTLDELHKALMASPRGKSPGCDGLTAEFYIAVWHILGEDFLAVANAMLQRRAVAPSHKQGVMVLLPKTSARPKTIKDLRPVTLLNVDGKTFSRAVASRMKDIQARILHPMQVQPGSTRNLHGALTDIRDAVSLAEHTKTPFALATLDIAGAFNNLRHDFLWQVLRQHGVSEGVVQLLQSMYDGATTRISIAGLLTEVVALLRGIRQGCCISMMLYCIASKVLVKAMDDRLQGLQVGEGRLAASSYVDDTVAVLRTQVDVDVLEDVLQRFGEESGLKVNAAKSMILPVGRLPRQLRLPFPVVKEVKVLGVTFAARTSRLATINWPGRVGVLRARLVDARLRAFNIVQRVQYANTYALPLLWHLAQVAPLPATHAAQVRKALGKFLWAAKRVRVPFDVLVQPKQRGGLGLQDPARKAGAMLAARWESSARAEMRTLSGSWLRELQDKYGDGGAPPACVKPFVSCYRSEPFSGIPEDLVGKDLTRSLYARALAKDVPVPRAMREVSVESQGRIWRAVHHKDLTVDVKAAWFETVHDVLPTAIRLQAARQTEAPECTKCQEPEDVMHRLTRCGDGRRQAWAWAKASIRDRTGVAIRDEDVVRPDQTALVNSALATAALGTVVQFLVTRRVVTAQLLKGYLKRKLPGPPL